MVKPLFKRNMSVMWRTFFIILAVLCMYTTVIIYMYDPKLSKMLSGYQQVMPQMMSAVGMTGIAGNLLEWIQIYLYGFLMILFPLIFMIILIQKLVMGYIDSGSMANLLATPNSRGRLIFTQLISAFLWIFLLMAAVTAVGILSCELMFPGELDVKRYLILNASALLMQTAVLGIIFLASCIFSEAKHYYAVGAGLPILFFLIQMISNMGEKTEKLRYLTIYTLFAADKAVSGEGGLWQENLVLALMALMLSGAGVWWFCRRDLSV